MLRILILCGAVVLIPAAVPAQEVFEVASVKPWRRTRRGLSATMPLLARMLTGFARRPVLDKTGLTGTYDVALSFSPESVIYVTRETGVREGGTPADGMSLSTALRDHLGLRLESARSPGEVLVIERAQRPTVD